MKVFYCFNGFVGSRRHLERLAPFVFPEQTAVAELGR